MANTLNHKQCASLIMAIGHKRTVLITGEAGSGKTSILHEMKKDPKYVGYHIIDPIDCAQLSDGSVLMPDIDREHGVSRELPNERFGVHKTNMKGSNGSKPIILCLDELGKSRQFIKDILAPVILERRLGSYHMPEGSMVFGTTNLTDEGLGDSIQAHMLDRLFVVHMRKPTKDEWVQDFAIPRGLHPSLIAAAEMFPLVFDSFQDYQAGGKYEGKKISKENPYINNPADGAQDKTVTPRSLHACSDLLHASDSIDEHTLTCGLEGAVGRAFTAQLMSFIRFGQELPAYARVVEDPEGCPVPKNPTAQLVQVFQFVTQVKDRVEAEAVAVYTSRMRAEMQSLLVNTVANSSRIDKFVMSRKFAALLASNRKFFNA